MFVVVFFPSARSSSRSRLHSYSRSRSHSRFRFRFRFQANTKLESSRLLLVTTFTLSLTRLPTIQMSAKFNDTNLIPVQILTLSNLTISFV